MRAKKDLSFPLIIIAVVLGATLFKQFDFRTFRFQNGALGVIYLLTFLMTLYFILKPNKEE